MPRKKLPNVSILDRRLANPFGAPSLPVVLKTPGQWTCRIVNSTVRTGRLHDMTQNKGWTYVLPEELMGTPDELGFRVQDTRVVRGEKGEEVLMKIPTSDFHEIQHAKTRANIKNLGKQQTLQEAANAVGKTLGDQAGETIAKATIDITDSRERIELEPEPV